MTVFLRVYPHPAFIDRDVIHPPGGEGRTRLQGSAAALQFLRSSVCCRDSPSPLPSPSPSRSRRTTVAPATDHALRHTASTTREISDAIEWFLISVPKSSSWSRGTTIATRTARVWWFRPICAARGGAAGVAREPWRGGTSRRSLPPSGRR